MHSQIIRHFNYLSLQLGGARKKVNTFIIGAQKGGTTALLNYLSHSPEVALNINKKPGFFSQNSYSSKSELKHESGFLHRNKRDRLLETSPDYLYYPFVAERIYRYNSEAKILILLRNPVSRAFSHYMMFKNLHDLSREKKEKLISKFEFSRSYGRPMVDLINREIFPSFSEIICNEIENGNEKNLEPSILRRGVYYTQVQKYLNIFPLENILIIESTSLLEQRSETLKHICEFLEINNQFLNEIALEKKHTGKYSEELNEEDRKFLKKFYENHNQILFELIKKDFDW